MHFIFIYFQKAGVHLQWEAIIQGHPGLLPFCLRAVAASSLLSKASPTGGSQSSEGAPVLGQDPNNLPSHAEKATHSKARDSKGSPGRSRPRSPDTGPVWFSAGLPLPGKLRLAAQFLRVSQRADPWTCTSRCGLTLATWARFLPL